MKRIIITSIAFALVLSGCGNSVKDQQKETERRANDIEKNYELVQNKQVDLNNEINKIIQSEDGTMYYLSDTDKRHIFTTDEVLFSWFPEINKDGAPIWSLEQMYDVPLGGNVFFKPSTLIQTESDPSVYLVAKNGRIQKVEDINLLVTIFGEGWESRVIDIPNRFFTAYSYSDSIRKIEDFPLISKDITIDTNQ